MTKDGEKRPPCSTERLHSMYMNYRVQFSLCVVASPTYMYCSVISRQVACSNVASKSAPRKMNMGIRVGEGDRPASELDAVAVRSGPAFLR